MGAMKRATIVFALTLLAACAMQAPPAFAWVDHTKTISAVKAAHAPSLDASLDDPAWKTALRADDFFDFDTRVPARHGTVAYFTYDDKYLYAAFQCQQKGVPLTATQTVDHAGLNNDDRVTFMIDTSGNNSRTYFFRVSPSGVKDEGSSESTRFAPEWDGVSKRTADGYNVVMRIPISALRIQSARSQAWRVDFGRFIAALSERYTWSYDPTMTGFAPQFFPVVDGISIAGADSRPKPHANVFALTAAGSDRLVYANGYQNGVQQFQSMNPHSLGADVTVPLSNTLSLVGTLSPDFSGIEEDQTQISPREFQRAYTEYRPFFAQGASFVNAIPQYTLNGIGEPLFYTPAIGAIDRGLKFEGTVAQSSIGMLNVKGPGLNDSAIGYAWYKPDNSFYVAAQSVIANHPGVRDDTTGISIGRVNTHSGEATGLQYEQETGTAVQSPSEARNIYLTEYFNTQRWNLGIAYKDVGPQFNPVDGYTLINDARGAFGFVQYAGAGRKGTAIKNYELHTNADRYRNRSNVVSDADVVLGGSVTLNSLFSARFDTGTSELRWYDEPFPVYAGPHDVLFNQRSVQLGFKELTANGTTLRYAWGPFDGSYMQQVAFSTHQQYGLFGLGFDFAGTVAHDRDASSQWLRRISVTRSFGKNASLAIGLRNINGKSPFAVPGSNIAASFQERFANGDMLLFGYGTPASPQTLHRVVLKYVFHAGGGDGT